LYICNHARYAWNAAGDTQAGALKLNQNDIFSWREKLLQGAQIACLRLQYNAMQLFVYPYSK